jgi:hypothetical protein
MPQAPCPFAAECALADRIGMEAALRVWQSFYCEGSCGRCQRYRLYQAGQEVPDRLLPNGRLLDGPRTMAGAVSRPGSPPELATPPRRQVA